MGEQFYLPETVNASQLYAEYRAAGLPIRSVTILSNGYVEVVFERPLTDTERTTFTTVRLAHRPDARVTGPRNLAEEVYLLKRSQGVIQ